MIYQLQARDSVSLAMYYWTSINADDTDYPGPNAAQEVTVISKVFVGDSTSLNAQSIAANPTGSAAEAASFSLATQTLLGRAAGNVDDLAIAANSVPARFGTGDLGGQAAAAGQSLSMNYTGDMGWLPNATYYGSGTPEGAVTATVGRLYVDTSGGIQWLKLSGTGNTGWSIIGPQPWLEFYLDTQTIATSGTATITALGTLGDGRGAWTRPSTTTIRAPYTGRYAIDSALRVEYSSTTNPIEASIIVNVNAVEKARIFGVRYNATAADPIHLGIASTLEITDTSHDITFVNPSASFTITTPSPDGRRRIRLIRLGPTGSDV